jgi:DNA-binding protein HU-alpha
MTKKALFERVKQRATGVKGRDLRIAMDAVLEELGAAIVEGDGVKIQPFGTLKVQRRKTLASGDLVVCKLRRKKPGPKGKDPLAEAAE